MGVAKKVLREWPVVFVTFYIYIHIYIYIIVVGPWPISIL